jgi:hypothetical protein
MSLSATTRQQRAERHAVILDYWRRIRDRYERDSQAARIVGNHCGASAVHVLYVVKLARERGEDV